MAQAIKTTFSFQLFVMVHLFFQNDKSLGFVPMFTEKYNVDYDPIQIFETSTVLKPSIFISCLLIITI